MINVFSSLCNKNVEAKAREFNEFRYLMSHGYDIDLDDFETPLTVILILFNNSIE